MDEMQNAPVTVRNVDPDEALARLTTALRAGLPGSTLGAGLQSSLVAGTDPFVFFGSPGGAPPADSAEKSRHYLPQQILADGGDSGAAMVDRRVAVMTQDMAAFGGAGREAPARLEAAPDNVRFDYFA